MNPLSTRCLMCAVVIALTVFSSCSFAQQYPTRAIRLVVPFAPGGSSDTLARIVGQRLAESLGQPVIIDNRPARGGTVGTDAVAKAQPDGYTFVIGSIATMAIAKAMYKDLPYDPMRDFEHISTNRAVDAFGQSVGCSRGLR